MKLFLYLMLFLAILGIAGFGFFSITTPAIPQTTITKDIPPKEAFGHTQDTLAPAPTIGASSPAPESSAPMIEE